MNKNAKWFMIIGSMVLFFAVLLGAFGAHGLESKNLSEKLMKTYQTGVRYQFYHGFGILILGGFQQVFKKINFKQVVLLFFVGILLFSVNCYLYTLTSNKVFAMIVPIGGVSFIAGWFLLAIKFCKVKEEL